MKTFFWNVHHVIFFFPKAKASMTTNRGMNRYGWNSILQLRGMNYMCIIEPFDGR